MPSTLQLKRQLTSEFTAVADETRGCLKKGKLSREGAITRLDVLEGIYERLKVVSQILEAEYEKWGYVDQLVKVRLDVKCLDDDFDNIKRLLRWSIHGPGVSFTGLEPTHDPFTSAPGPLYAHSMHNTKHSNPRKEKERLEKELEELERSKRDVEENIKKLSMIEEEKEGEEEQLLSAEELKAAERLARIKAEVEHEENRLRTLREKSAIVEGLSPIFVDKKKIEPQREYDLMRFELDHEDEFRPGAMSTPLKVKPDPSMAFTRGEPDISEDLPELYKLLRYKRMGMEIDTQSLHEETLPGVNDPSRYLSKIPLVKFNGDKKGFLGWWTSFVECVDKSPLPPVVKLLRLRSCLKDEPLREIDGFGISEHAYEVAKEALQRKYGGIRRQLTLVSDELHTFKAVRDNNQADLERLASLLDRLVVNLKSSGNTGELGAGYLYNGILRKMTPALITKYQRWMTDNQQAASVVTLRFFVNQKAEFLTLASESLYGFTNKPEKGKKSEARTLFGNAETPKSAAMKTGSVSGSTTDKKSAEQKIRKCKVCSKDHGVWDCESFKKLSVQDRWKKMKELSLCLKCLGGHNYKKCWRKKKCSSNGCTMPHHELLHNETASTEAKTMMSQSKDSEEKEDSIDDSEQEDASTHHTKSIGDNLYVAFRTVPVIVSNGRKSIRINALLDEASNKSYLSDHVKDYLELTGPTRMLRVKAVGESQQLVESTFVSCTLENDAGTLKRQFEARTLPEISSGLRLKDLNRRKDEWPHLKDIVFPKPAGPTLDALIGLDNMSLMISECDVPGPENSDAPVARLTPLGWTCAGEFGARSSSSPYNETSYTHFTLLDPDINYSLKRFWELEEVDVAHSMTSDERKAVKIAEETITRDEDGRYGIGVPWKSKPETSEENYDMAYKRLVSTERKLDKSPPEVADKYQETIDEYIKKGYIRKVLKSLFKGKKPNARWFLPHFAVIRDKALSTALRIVYDAAAEVRGHSLNYYILPGPKLQRCLIDVLLKFRRNAIALSSDVQQMYMQIWLKDEDRPYHSLLWRDRETDREPDVYEFQRVVFGSNASPFLAQFVARKNAESFADTKPRAADMILNGTYMDDGHDSVHSVEEGIELVSDVKHIWNSARMTIHKWWSNSREVLESIPIEERVKKIDLSKNEIPKVKALGCHVDADTDEFQFETDVHSKALPQTKREFLCILATVFDPLGLASPVIVKGKHLMQRCWLTGLSWDEVLPDNLLAEIHDWIEDIKDLPRLRVARMVFPSENSMVLLHCFSDASGTAYGAVVFSVAFEDGKEPWITLVASKSRVAPLNSIHINRLELEAAVLGSKLLKKVAKGLGIPDDQCFLWVDSANVLFWVRACSRDYKPYVAHRISVIQELFEPARFRHIPGVINPADIVSRCATTKDLLENSLWKTGPDFIKNQDKDTWPNAFPPKPNECTLEKKKFSVFVHLTQAESVIQMDLKDTRLEPSRWSSLVKLLRVTANVVRAIKKMRRLPHETGPLTGIEIQEALTAHIIYAQTIEFAEDRKSIVAEKDISSKSSLLGLKPWISEDGVIRSNSRLTHGDLIPWEMRYPIILPGHQPITSLIISDAHVKNGHASVNWTLSHLLQEYWLLRGREQIRSVKNTCMTCRKNAAKLEQPEMAPLPKHRIQGMSVPFTVVSVDFAGPYLTMAGRGKPRYKRYVCLYTCLHTRAVHLEMVSSLSTQHFLLALERIIWRRGKPEVCYSDNGTNLVGAVTTLTKLEGVMTPDEIKAGTSNTKIEWKFQPPRAPHFSGVHESLVKSAKRALDKVMPQADVTDEELGTALCKVEGLLNDRPLTYQTLDARDPVALTPSYFNIGRRAVPLVPEENADQGKQYRERWLYVQNLISSFWSRWMKEWVVTLSPRKKWHKRSTKIQEGDLVLIADDDTPRGNWKMGKILRTFPGRDGVTRVVDVKTPAGTYRRPVVRVCLLESNVR